jgi:hypothetical protein
MEWEGQAGFDESITAWVEESSLGKDNQTTRLWLKIALFLAEETLQSFLVPNAINQDSKMFSLAVLTSQETYFTKKILLLIQNLREELWSVKPPFFQVKNGQQTTPTILDFA